MRKFGFVLALVSMMSLCSCMAGPIMAVEAVDDMVVDVVPGDEYPRFVLPGVGNLHDVDWSWHMLLPWTWFGLGTS
jgi:hypothetical protein